MQTAFLIIITLLGCVYALLTRQGKTAVGLFIMVVAFGLQIPNLVTGFWVDILSATSLILFTLGVGMIVWKFKNKEIFNSTDVTTDHDNQRTKD